MSTTDDTAVRKHFKRTTFRVVSVPAMGKKNNRYLFPKFM